MGLQHAADRIVDGLIKAGITHSFGLPDGSTMELYKALHGRDAQLRPVACCRPPN
jgi:thiamine pyrophosphate-dependent acetolactate synthase large subunit-like protein